MLFHLWLAVMPRRSCLQPIGIASDFEARLHAGAEPAQLIGAAGHVARYTPLAARAS
jgi:hypothetical protein